MQKRHTKTEKGDVGKRPEVEISGDLRILTSEKAHIAKYGEPIDCWNQYLQTYKDSDEELKHHLNVILGNEIEEKRRTIVESKHNLLTSVFDFSKCKRVLDIGGMGSTTPLLLKKYPNIEKIMVLDGNKTFIDFCKDKLPEQIEVIYCDFYEKFTVTGEKFDTIFQFDVAEHLPDALYISLTRFLVENFLEEGGRVFVYSPDYPFASDQVEHISVKSLGFFVFTFLILNMTITRAVSIFNRNLMEVQL